LTALNLQISSAKISTYGEKVIDVFYVKNLFGHKMEHGSRIEETRKALLAVLAEPEPAAAAPVRRPRRAAAAAE
jgi:[protein-PII] uridylyltransferase